MSKRVLSNVSGAESLVERLPEVGAEIGSNKVGGGNQPAPADHREKSSRAAFEKGYEAGFRQGLEDARAQEQVILENFRRELAAVVDRIEKAMILWYDKAEHGLAELSIDIARKVVGDALERNPDAILEVVREAMARVELATRAVIRVNTSDLPAIEERKPDVIAAAQSVREVQFVGDDSLSRGSVVIETEEGVVDASVESKALRLLRGEAA